MPDPVETIAPERLADLRRRAAPRLAGTAATKGAITSATDALAVLHGLASVPETASDALTLLHELQVHQVELDLQAQELRESRAELETALRRLTELHDFQPVGCFSVDARLVLHELNRTGATMLGIAEINASGMTLDAFLCPESSRSLRVAIAGIDSGAHPPSRSLRLQPRNGPERRVLASIDAAPSANHYLLALMNGGDDPERPPETS